MHMNEVLPQGPRSETKEQEGPQGGIPHVAGHTLMRGPKNGSYPSMSSPRSFGAKPQKVAFHKVTIKLIFTIHDDIFQRLIELKIFMWAKNISNTH
jgi:hypothetical protein